MDHINQIFPVTYFKTNIENNSTLKKVLLPKIIETYDSLPIPDGWITNKVKTSFDNQNCTNKIFFGEDQIYQNDLQPEYKKCFDRFFGDTQYEINISQIWYNLYLDGEFQERHDHLSRTSIAHFSCIHFLSFDSERHKPVKFRDPLDQIRCHSIEIKENRYLPYHYPDIKEGDFIMFPSYLIHSVDPSPQTLDYPRITISFNFRILEYANEQYQY